MSLVSTHTPSELTSSSLCLHLTLPPSMWTAPRVAPWNGCVVKRVSHASGHHDPHALQSHTHTDVSACSSASNRVPPSGPPAYTVPIGRTVGTPRPHPAAYERSRAILTVHRVRNRPGQHPSHPARIAPTPLSLLHASMRSPKHPSPEATAPRAASAITGSA